MKCWSVNYFKVTLQSIKHTMATHVANGKEGVGAAPTSRRRPGLCGLYPPLGIHRDVCPPPACGPFPLGRALRHEKCGQRLLSRPLIPQVKVGTVATGARAECLAVAPQKHPSTASRRTSPDQRPGLGQILQQAKRDACPHISRHPMLAECRCT